MACAMAFLILGNATSAFELQDLSLRPPGWKNSGSYKSDPIQVRDLEKVT